MALIDSKLGPMKIMPFLLRASTNLNFSERKP